MVTKYFVTAKVSRWWMPEQILLQTKAERPHCEVLPARNGNGNIGNHVVEITSKCSGYGKVGHKVPACWNKDKNKTKRPRWFRIGKVNAVATDIEKDEVAIVFLDARLMSQTKMKDESGAEQKQRWVIKQKTQQEPEFFI